MSKQSWAGRTNPNLEISSVTGNVFDEIEGLSREPRHNLLLLGIGLSPFWILQLLKGANGRHT